MSTQGTLFDAHGRFVLWGRESPRRKWRVIGTADTGPEAYGLIDGSGIRGGDWMVIEDGSNPNDRKRNSDHGEEVEPEA